MKNNSHSFSFEFDCFGTQARRLQQMDDFVAVCASHASIVQQCNLADPAVMTQVQQH
jgi:hypothetical protein